MLIQEQRIIHIWLTTMKAARAPTGPISSQDDIPKLFGNVEMSPPGPQGPRPELWRHSLEKAFSFDQRPAERSLSASVSNFESTINPLTPSSLRDHRDSCGDYGLRKHHQLHIGHDMSLDLHSQEAPGYGAGTDQGETFRRRRHPSLDLISCSLLTCLGNLPPTHLPLPTPRRCPRARSRQIRMVLA